MAEKEALLAELARCVLEMEDEAVVDVAKSYVEAGFDAYEGITEGLAKGMEKAGQLYEEEEYFVPELLICSDAMYNGLEILKPHLKRDNSSKGCGVLIGVVEGDTHDIGKNLVKMMMEGKGLEVIDLGVDVSPEQFVDTAKNEGCQIICCSALLTTTMGVMGDVVKAAESAGIRDSVKIMVGGAPVTDTFCQQIGADKYTPDAATAADTAVAMLA